MFNQNPAVKFEECYFDKIYQSALNKDIKALKKLLDRGVCIDVNKNNQTPVYLLAYEGKCEAAKFLIDELNASLDEAVKGAAEANNASFTYELLEEGADINSAVEGAASGNHISLLDDLLKLGGAIESGLQGASIHNRTELIDRFLKQNPKINSMLCGAGMGGQFDLIISSKHKKGVDLDYAVFGLSIVNKIEYVNELIDKYEAKMDYACQGAAQGGHFSSVLDYIKKGGNIHYAVWGAGAGGHTDFTFYLLSIGADIELALEGAIVNNHIELMNKLINKDVKDVKKELIVSKVSSDHILKNQKRFFRLLSFIDNKEIREELITLAMLQYPSFDKKTLLIETTYVNQLIRNGFNFNQALCWLNFSEKDKYIIAVWFLQGIQLVEKKIIHLEILIHIASHLLKQTFVASRDIYNKCSTNKSIFFLSKNQLSKSKVEENNNSICVKKL